MLVICQKVIVLIQAAWQSQVREFAQEELRPLADTFDVEKRFPTEQVAKLKIVINEVE